MVALDAVIDGESMSIIVDCARNPPQAWLNSCPHQGSRLDYAPGKFLIHKGQLVCAVHGATFELEEGLCVGGPCRGEHLAKVAVIEEDGALRFEKK